ncbi:MAG TPA: chemotaxis response regulator protein-glutamate methylesterase [Thermoanaerobaculia bacterium]|nr:chemotaxis response regulator protein-glutamate methylesterase [Thermoanaerobaculia bacterium]
MHVLVVDDSATVRQSFSMLLAKNFTVDTAADPIIAARKIAKTRPDVVVLDLQMPRMDGLSFLKQIMRRDPLPVVICSSAAARGSDTAMRALEEGAVDVILKPAAGVRDFIAEQSVMIVDTLRAASQARLVRTSAARPVVPLPPENVGRASARPGGLKPALRRIVAIGASTGGTEALRVIIERLPPNAPPVVVVQHMPEGFTAAFAKRLDALSAVEVKEAADGDVLRAGRVLIAPGSQHLLVRRIGGEYFASLNSGPLVSRHRPSVDVLFRSMASSAAANGIGIILTGMGDDGADGLAEMRNAGAMTIAQDEATSVIFGMPKEAIARGAVQSVLPLPHIAPALVSCAGLKQGVLQ